VGVNIHIQPEEVWSFFQKNKERLSEEMVAIAENEETEYAVYLTEDEGYPQFSVCKGDKEPEYEEGAISERDCTDTAKKCFVRYLFPVVVSGKKIPFDVDEDEDEDDPRFTKQEQEDAAYEREDELMFALGDFLQTVLREGADGSEVIDTYGIQIMNEILDHVLEYLAYEHDFLIYRPTFLAEESGECYVEYPYNELDGEDLSDSLSYGSLGD